MSEAAVIEAPAVKHRSVCCSAPLTPSDVGSRDTCAACGEPAHKKRGRKPGDGAPSGDAHPRRQRAKREARILELTAKNIPIAEIARAVCEDERTVRWYVDKHRSMLEALTQVDKYRDTRARILTAAEMVLIQSMVQEDKLEKATVNNLAYAYRQIHDTRRLEEGLSTANVATQIRFTRIDVTDRSETD